MIVWVKSYQLFAALLLVNIIAAAHAENDASPSMEFLEFLGEFQTDDGEWIDPLNLLDMEQDELNKEHQRDEEDQPNE
jgi:hypothetical protein